MSIIQKQQRRLSHTIAHDETAISSIGEQHGKALRTGKIPNRLRMLVEQLPNGRKRLHLKGIDTLAIPDELYELTDLDILDITPQSKSGMNYTLSRVPPALRVLSNLKCLHLDNNDIVSVPNEIGQLRHLEILTISHNHLTALPDEIKQLQNLQSLHLSCNKFEEMPLSVCYLSKSLLFLDLSYNYLRELPTSIQYLKQLRTLLLIGNRLKTLPDSVCQLTKLETLWLGDNRLKELPKHFYQLKHLDWQHHCELSSNFEGNPLKNPPLEICRKGINAIEEYLKTKQEKQE